MGSAWLRYQRTVYQRYCFMGMGDLCLNNDSASPCPIWWSSKQRPWMGTPKCGRYLSALDVAIFGFHDVGLLDFYPIRASNQKNTWIQWYLNIIIIICWFLGPFSFPTTRIRAVPLETTPAPCHASKVRPSFIRRWTCRGTRVPTSWQLWAKSDMNSTTGHFLRLFQLLHHGQVSWSADVAKSK